jgi:hypothetical protein
MNKGTLEKKKQRDMAEKTRFGQSEKIIKRYHLGSWVIEDCRFMQETGI